MPEIDDFENYPTPQKATNWTLPQKRRGREAALRTTNRTDDIEGSQSGTTEHYHILKLTRNKPNLFSTNDIYGAQPQCLHPERNKPKDRTLRNDDIPRSKPDLHAFSSSRTTNPLIPQYKLASLSSPVVPPPPGKFVRDNMLIHDIPGTSPGRQSKHSRGVHDVLDFSDIPGTSPCRSHSRHRVTLSKNMDTVDIMHCNDSVHRSHRVTDPLSPHYKVTSPHGPEIIGEILGGRPRELREQRKVNCSAILTTRDIDGASPGNPYRQRW